LLQVKAEVPSFKCFKNPLLEQSLTMPSFLLNSFSQLLTSLPMGYISNSIGRKPVLIIGQVACIVGILAFGLSPNYTLALLAHIFVGALNAIIGAWKCMIGNAGLHP
jgi:MFS family permease